MFFVAYRKRGDTKVTMIGQQERYSFKPEQFPDRASAEEYAKAQAEKSPGLEYVVIAPVIGFAIPVAAAETIPYCN